MAGPGGSLTAVIGPDVAAERAPPHRRRFAGPLFRRPGKGEKTGKKKNRDGGISFGRRGCGTVKRWAMAGNESLFGWARPGLANFYMGAGGCFQGGSPCVNNFSPLRDKKSRREDAGGGVNGARGFASILIGHSRAGALKGALCPKFRRDRQTATIPNYCGEGAGLTRRQRANGRICAREVQETGPDEFANSQHCPVEMQAAGLVTAECDGGARRGVKDYAGASSGAPAELE